MGSDLHVAMPSDRAPQLGSTVPSEYCIRNTCFYVLPLAVTTYSRQVFLNPLAYGYTHSVVEMIATVQSDEK